MPGANGAQAPCHLCGSIIRHLGVCPSVKAIEYYPDGTVRRMEFMCPSDYAIPVSVPDPSPAPPLWSLKQWGNLC